MAQLYTHFQYTYTSNYYRTNMLSAKEPIQLRILQTKTNNHQSLEERST